uniref:Gpm573 n=2 Tax=Arundo donax TaxID=35708 RepID=A0A0A9G508_ARUDO
MFDPEGMLCQLLQPILMSLSVLSAELVLTIVTPMKNSVSLLIRLSQIHQLGISSFMHGRHCLVVSVLQRIERFLH